MSDSEILQRRLEAIGYENRFKATLYRWYCFYERAGASIERHGELVTDDFRMIRPPQSGLPSVTGKQAFLASLQLLPTDQENAHWFEHVRMDGSRAEIHHGYQARGPRMTGAARLRYDIEVEDAPPNPVRFRSLRESVVGFAQAPFQDAYAFNRAAAFVYRWLTLVERVDDAVEAAPELFAEPFAMHLSSGAILRDVVAVTQWLRGNGARVSHTAHVVDGLRVDAAGDQVYRVAMDFRWAGIGRDGTPLQARTHHAWSLVDDGGRLPRLREFRVSIAQDFAPTTSAAALAHVASDP